MWLEGCELQLRSTMEQVVCNVVEGCELELRSIVEQAMV